MEEEVTGNDIREGTRAEHLGLRTPLNGVWLLFCMRMNYWRGLSTRGTPNLDLKRIPLVSVMRIDWQERGRIPFEGQTNRAV